MEPKKPKRKNTQDPRYKHLDTKTTDAASSTDFTGLIPAGPHQTDGALDAYQEVHEFGEFAGEND